MYRRPVVGIAVCMAVGIFTGYSTGISLLSAYIGFFVFTIGSLVAWIIEKKTEKGVTFISICLSVFFLGMVLIQGERQSLAHHPLVTTLRGKALSIRGTICTFPRKGYNRFSFPLKIEQIKKENQWQDIDGKILVNVYDSREDFKIGDQLEIKGYLKPLPEMRNPADFDYGAYLLRKGILGQISIKQGKMNLEILSRNNINFIRRIAAYGRDWMERIIDLGPYNGREGLLKAMLIGKRESLDETFRNNFIDTGTAHIMAISGLHLVIVMAIILFMCRVVAIPDRWSSGICIVSLIIYAFLTGGRPSVWRAAIMAILFLCGRLLNRQIDRWTSLAMAGLIILSISPQALFDSGFQLTFIAVGGLMYFYPRLENILVNKFKQLFDNVIIRYFIKAMLVVSVVQISLGPFLIYNYYRFPLTTFIANLAVIPLLGIIITLGFVASIAGFISFSLARVFNAANNIFLLVMDKITSFLANIPGNVVYLPRPSPVVFLFYYIFLFLAFLPLKAENIHLNTSEEDGI